LLATTLAGVLSITAAAIFSFAFLSKVVERMVSLSVGIMLSTSLLHALPEAFESQADPRSLFATLLAGLLAFFMLENSRFCAIRTTTKAMATTMRTATTSTRRARPAG